jgi:hypothetical protein
MGKARGFGVVSQSFKQLSADGGGIDHPALRWTPQADVAVELRLT